MTKCECNLNLAAPVRLGPITVLTPLSQANENERDVADVRTQT